MSRVVRGQLALDTGERIKELGTRVLKLHEFSGDALETQLSTIYSGLGAQLMHVGTLVKSCRAAKNSYPNFPALRKAIGDAGDQCYEIEQDLRSLIDDMQRNVGSYTLLGNELLTLAQRLKLVQFVPPEHNTKVGS